MMGGKIVLYAVIAPPLKCKEFKYICIGCMFTVHQNICISGIKQKTRWFICRYVSFVIVWSWDQVNVWILEKILICLQQLFKLFLQSTYPIICTANVWALVRHSLVIRRSLSSHYHQDVKSVAAVTLALRITFQGEGAPCEIYLAVPIS